LFRYLLYKREKKKGKKKIVEALDACFVTCCISKKEKEKEKRKGVGRLFCYLLYISYIPEYKQ
jgi:hypothetical protein